MRETLNRGGSPGGAPAENEMQTLHIVKHGQILIQYRRESVRVPEVVSQNARLGDLRLRYLPSLWDDLYWGPHHSDLSPQRLLRECYFGATREGRNRFGLGPNRDLPLGGRAADRQYTEPIALGTDDTTAVGAELLARP